MIDYAKVCRWALQPLFSRLEEGLAGGLLFLRGEPRRYHFRGHGSHLEDGGSQGSSHGRIAKH